MKISKILMTMLLIPHLLLAGTPADDFNDEVQSFYLSPSRQKFESLQQNASEIELILRNTDSNSDLLAAAMFAVISEKYGWKIQDDNHIGIIAHEILEGETKRARYISDDSKVDLLKLDIWWMSFFATGETTYLNKVYYYANYPAETLSDDEMRKWVSIAAVWSFECNSKSHKAVRDYASKQVKTDQYNEIIEYLNSSL